MKNHQRKEYRIYASIKTRCYNKNHSSYVNYGGRGIRMSKEWLLSFNNFYKDMGERPSIFHSIERIDCNKDYCKENCKWATTHEQSRNKRNNFYIVYNGVSMIERDWEIKLNFNQGVIRKRRLRGWSIEKILTTPIMANYNDRRLKKPQ